MFFFEWKLQITTWQSMAVSLYHDEVEHFTKDGT